MTATETATQASARIRREIKTTLGLNSRDVGVRTELYSMGSSIYVTIKTMRAFEHRARISELVHDAARVSYDGYTGEILSGGNRFSHFGYSEACRDAVAARNIEAMEAARAELGEDPQPGEWVRVPGTTSLALGFSADYHQLEVFDLEGHERRLVNSTTEAAFVAETLN